MSAATRRFLGLYGLALYAAPGDFRRQHAAEMMRLVAERLDERSRGAGAGAWLGLAAFELGDVVRAGLRLRAGGAGRMGGGLPLGAAFRTLRRRPAFAVLCATTLALGLGVAMTIGAVVDSVLVRPLPYIEAGRLVMVWRVLPGPGITRGPTSYLDYLDWRASARSFTDLAAFTGTSLTLETGEPEQFAGLRVSGSLFRTLGNRPSLGRVIQPGDDQPSAEPVVVLSDGLWRRRFGADSSIVGRHLAFGERRFRVVGVMPGDFAFPNRGPQFWTALRVDPAATERDANRYTVLGRLAPGATIETAQREMETLNARLGAAYPTMNKGAGVRLESRQASVTRQVRSLLLLIGLAGAVVLIMAGVNLGNLFLVRGVARRREVAVRRALGATRGSIRRDAIAESALIALAGGVAGAAVAAGLTKLFLHLGPPIPRATEIALTPRVIAAGLAVSFLATIVAGLASVSRSRSAEPGGSLAASGRGGDVPRARRLYTTFVAAQIALAFTLFVAAGLLTRSFYNLVTVPRGFDGARILTAHISLPPARYESDEKILTYYDRLLAGLRALPGVEVASGTWALPFSDDFASSSIVPDDRPLPDRPPPPIAVLPVLPSFFQSLGVPLREGRDFSARDDARAPEVAIVNATLARRFWPGGSAIGKRLRSAKSREEPPVTIVGVMGDIKRRGLDLPTEPEVYRPYAQAVYSGDLYVTLRASGDPLALVHSLRRVAADLDRALPLALVGTLERLVGFSIIAPRFRAMLIGVFAALAGLMALVGVYGVLGFVVARRKHEIAIRGALGATSGRAVRSVAGQAAGIALLGMSAGLLGAVGVSFGLRSMVFGISAFDPVAFVAAIVALGVVAAVGCWLPARRAARVDPMLVLREDASL